MSCLRNMTIKVNKLSFFSWQYFLKKMKPCSQCSYVIVRNTRGSSGELEKAVETIACWFVLKK